MAWILDLSTTPPDIYTDNTVQGNLYNCLEPPYPAPMWYVSENPYDVRTAATKDYHTPCFDYPYPAPMWYVTPDGDDVRTAVTRTCHICFDHPFPYFLWFVDTNPDDVTHDYFFNPEDMGAFRKARNLNYAKIPANVKSLGYEAFADTDLQEVTIAQDCQYSSTTFPASCQVKFYEGE